MPKHKRKRKKLKKIKVRKLKKDVISLLVEEGIRTIFLQAMKRK